MEWVNRCHFGDCLTVLRSMPDAMVHTCVTSPPYFGLRDYGHAEQIGLEPTPDEFIGKLVEVFREVRRVLTDDGTLWLNLGDSYNAAGRTGHGTRQGFKQGTNRASDTGADNCRPSVDSLKPKDLIGIPWRVAFALQEAGWYLRQDIIWHKPNPMPESVTDRCTKAHEYLFLLSKSERYFFDHDAIKEASVTNDLRRPYGSPGANMLDPRGKQGEGKLRGKGGKNAFRGQGHFREGEAGPANREGRDMQDVGASESRNKRSVWTVATQPYSGAHFATFPPELIEPCILAGSRPGDTVLDCFFGSGTTGEVAGNFGRQWIGCELNTDYAPLQRARTAQAGLAL